MKSKLLLVLLVIALTSCQQTKERYTQNSSEINTVKALIKGYNDMNYDLSAFADTCKTYFNSKNKHMGNNDLLAYHKSNDEKYSSRKFLDKDQEYEMVLTDDGETWVNCWLDWQGKIMGSDKVFDIPIHLTYRFVDGKIVRQVGMWNTAEIINAIKKTAMNSSHNDNNNERAALNKVAEIEEMPKATVSASSKKDKEDLSAKIAELLRKPDFEVDENSKGQVRLTVNSSNQIIVLGVDTGHPEVKDFIQDRLNYHQLDFDFSEKMKVYTLTVKIQAD